MRTVRASSLSYWADCNRRSAASIFGNDILAAGYVLNKLPGNIGAAVGTATHAGGTWAMGEKAKTGEVGNKTEAIHRSIESLSMSLSEGVRFDDISENMNTAQRQVIRQLDSYMTYVGPIAKPIETEIRITASFSDHIELSGQPDILEDGAIRDLKAGNKQAIWSAQVGAYSLLIRSNGWENKRVIIDHVPRVPIKKPQPPPETYEYDVGRSEILAHETLRRIEGDYLRFVETQDADVFLPNPNSMLCSAKWCPAHGTDFCRHHKETI